MATDIPSLDRHFRLFDTIARPYSLFFSAQRRFYKGLLEEHGSFLGVVQGANILDVGCGPGPLAAAFANRGCSVQAVDGSRKMVEAATRHGISSQVADATNRLPFEDNEFNFAVAASVAHGMVAENRRKMFEEMKRVSSDGVLLHDYSPANDGFSPFTVIGILERLEKSDYVAFRRCGGSELLQIFESVNIIPTSSRTAWYVCS